MKFNKAVPVLPVGNIHDAIEFYQCRLGFDCLYHNEVFARICANDVELHLWTNPTPTRTHSCACRIQVSDIEALYHCYQLTGAVNGSLVKIALHPWGQRDFTIPDLHGNVLTFYEEST